MTTRPTTPVLMLVLLLTGCLFLKPDYVKEISPLSLSEAMKQNKLFLVDVHIPEQNHIKGTVLFVPYNQIQENLNRFPPDKTTPVYLYCESGPMGNAAARVLHDNGYQTLFNLKGGAEAWLAAGYEFQK